MRQLFSRISVAILFHSKSLLLPSGVPKYHLIEVQPRKSYTPRFCCQKYPFTYQWGRFLLLLWDLKVSLDSITQFIEKSLKLRRRALRSVWSKRHSEIIVPKLAEILSVVKVYKENWHLDMRVIFWAKIPYRWSQFWNNFWSLAVMKINTDYWQISKFSSCLTSGRKCN